MVVREIAISVDFDGVIVYKPITFVQNDYQTCRFNFTTADAFVAGETMFVSFVLPSGTPYIVEAAITTPTGTSAILLLPTGVLSEVGEVEMQVAVYNKAGLRNTNYMKMVMNVVEDFSNEAIEASDQFPILTELISDCNDVLDAEAARNIFEVYDEMETYSKGNKVSYGGSSYVCILESTGNLPTDDTYWLVIAQKGTDGTNGADGADGINGVDGADGTNGVDGANGTDGTNGADGADGIGIVSVIRTSGTGTAGTTDTYTITFTDDSTTNFNVYNGADGEGAGDMLKSVYDPNTVNGDAFNMDNMAESSTKKILTSDERTKLGTIAEGAEVNVQSDWNASSGDAQILNKPTIPTVPSIANNLTTETTGSTLDATQGKILNDRVNELGGLSGKETVFSGNVITETRADGSTLVTTFNGDGTITEQLTVGLDVTSKKTTFNADGSISEVMI